LQLCVDSSKKQVETRDVPDNYPESFIKFKEVLRKLLLNKYK